MNGIVSSTARRYVYSCYLPPSFLLLTKVHQEFGELFAMKVLIFVQELLSVILTPFVLWFSLPACAPAIIDFFREFTVHVDGRGYVCSFAEFNFERHGNVKASRSSNNDRITPDLTNSSVLPRGQTTKGWFPMRGKWRRAS